MIPSGRAAIIAYTMPVWAVPLSVWLLGERMDARKLFGLALDAYRLDNDRYPETAQGLQALRATPESDPLPPRWRGGLKRLQDFLELAFVLLFFWQAWRIARRAIVEGQRDISTLNMPLSVITIILPVGLGLMALTYLCMIIDGFLRPDRPKASPPEALASIE